MATDRTKRAMIRETVRALPNGTQFTAKDLTQIIRKEHPKAHVSSSIIASHLRECEDLVDRQRDSHTSMYTRRVRA